MSRCKVKVKRNKYRSDVRNKLTQGLTNGAGGNWAKTGDSRAAVEAEAIQSRLAYNSARNIRARSDRGKHGGSKSYHA